MSAITGQDIGLDILKALGLDTKGVRSIGLQIGVGEVVTADIAIERLVQSDEGERLVKVLEQYELHRKPEDVTTLESEVAVIQ